MAIDPLNSPYTGSATGQNLNAQLQILNSMSTSQLQAELVAAQASYDAAQAQVNADIALVAQINTDIQTCVTLVQQGASASAIQAARAQLNTHVNALINSGAVNYGNPHLSQVTLASQYLMDVQYEIYQRAYTALSNSLDYEDNSGPFGGGGGGFSNSIIRNLNNQTIDNAIDALQTAQENFSTALNSFNANEITLQNARNELYDVQMQTTYQTGYAILQDSNQSHWAQIVASNALPAPILAQYQAPITAALSQRSTLQTALTTAQTAYYNAVAAPATDASPGLIAALSSVGNAAQNYIDMINASREAIDAAQTSALDLLTSADQAARAAHLLLYPSTDPTLTAIRDAASQAIADAQAGVQLSLQPALSTTFPQLPPPGVRMSMSQLMDYIANSQVLMTQIAKNSTLDTAALVGRRLQILTSVLSALSVVMSRGVSYANNIIYADQLYVQPLYDINDARRAAQEAALEPLQDSGGIFGQGSSVDIINNAIDAINQENAQLSDDLSQNTIDELNSVGADVTDILNQAQTFAPGVMNALDNTNQDPDAPLPTPLPPPATITSPPAVPPISHISSSDIPSYVPGTPILFSNQAEVDAYNLKIAALNDKLGPIAAQLAEHTSPPLIYTPIPLLYYDNTTYRYRISDIFDSSGLQAEISLVSGMVNALSKQIVDTFALATNPTVLKYINPGSILSAPNSAKQQGTGGAAAGNTMVTADAGASAGTTGAVLTSILSKTSFAQFISDVLEETSLMAGLKSTAEATPPAAPVGRGLLADIDEPTEASIQASAASSQALQDKQLNAVADTLLSSAGDTVLLLANAQLLIAQVPEASSLSESERASVTRTVIALQQLVLTFVAGLALSATGNPSPEAGLQALQALFQGLSIPVAPAPVALTTNTPLTFPDRAPITVGDVLNNKIPQDLSSSDTTRLRNQLNDAFRAAGIPGQVATNAPIGQAVQDVLDEAPDNLISGLGINLDALPDDVKARLITRVNTAVPSLTSLTPEQKTSIAVGYALGTISPAQVGVIVSNLVAVQTEGATPENISRLAAAFSPVLAPVGASVPATEIAGAPLIPADSTAGAGIAFASPPSVVSSTVVPPAVVPAAGPVSAGAAPVVGVPGVTVAASLTATITPPASPPSTQPGVTPSQAAFEVLSTSPDFDPVTQALRAFSRTERLIAQEAEEDAVREAERPKVETLRRDTVLSPETTIPGVRLQKFREAVEKLDISEKDKKVFTQLLTSFSDSIITQTNFYQFAISMILDPAKFYVKNFSLITAEKGKGDMFPGSTNSIPV